MVPPPFRHIACQLEGGVLVVRLLDSKIQGDDVAEDLRKELHEASASFPTKKWALDFRNVQFFSSGGIRPLLMLHRNIQGTVGRMVFCNLKQDLLDVFVATRLISPARPSTAPFELAVDLADALAKLRHHTLALVDGVLIFTFNDENLHGDELADELSAAMAAALAATPVTKVVLDFQHVQAIATPCMRPMFQLRSRLLANGGTVVLANLSILVEEVLAITRIIAPNPTVVGLFDSYPDIESAIKALKTV